MAIVFNLSTWYLMKNVIGVEQGSYCFIPSLKDCTFDRAMILVKNTRMSTWLTYYSSPKLHHKATISYFLREPTSTAQSKSYYSFSSISHCGRLKNLHGTFQWSCSSNSSYLQICLLSCGFQHYWTHKYDSKLFHYLSHLDLHRNKVKLF